VEITLRELTGDFSKQYIKLKFEVDNVAGKIANTVYTGHTVTTDYVRSMIRRGTSRIDATVVAKSNDDHEIKLHVLAITTRRSKSSQQKYMREMIQDIVKKSASHKNFEELIETSVNGRLASDVYHKAKKIYPLKRVEVIKSKVIK
ncbi:MAG: 30S ribosomal protein S3ae, partial [Methanobacteriaceae archaeon]